VSAAATIVWFRQDLRVRDNPALRAWQRGSSIPLTISHLRRLPLRISGWSSHNPGTLSRGSAQRCIAPLSLRLRQYRCDERPQRGSADVGETLIILRGLLASEDRIAKTSSIGRSDCSHKVRSEKLLLGY
jgi:hypothetical protein